MKQRTIQIWLIFLILLTSIALVVVEYQKDKSEGAAKPMQSLVNYLTENKCYSDLTKKVNYTKSKRTQYTTYLYNDGLGGSPQEYRVMNNISADRVVYHALPATITYLCREGDLNIATNLIFPNMFAISSLSDEDRISLIEISKTKPVSAFK